MKNNTMNKETLELIKNLKEESRKTFLSVKDATSDSHAYFLRGKAIALRSAALMMESL
tara:strand:+ start:97 stop:270 length:174 start_codon:yes stop_codon:yes gene_type:complete